jgi:hypothetical protein
MDLYLFAFCLLPIMAVIGMVFIMARERRTHDRHGPWSR